MGAPERGAAARPPAWPVHHHFTVTSILRGGRTDGSTPIEQMGTLSLGEEKMYPQSHSKSVTEEVAGLPPRLLGGKDPCIICGETETKRRAKPGSR